MRCSNQPSIHRLVYQVLYPYTLVRFAANQGNYEVYVQTRPKNCVAWDREGSCKIWHWCEPSEYVSYSAFLLYVLAVSGTRLEYAISCPEWLTWVRPAEVLGPAFICHVLFILHAFHFLIRKHPTAWHSGTASWNSQRTYQQTRLDANFIHV
jgi:hypothetical protein